MSDTMKGAWSPIVPSRRLLTRLAAAVLLEKGLAHMVVDPAYPRPPKPVKNEILIQVKAAAINPCVSFHGRLAGRGFADVSRDSEGSTGRWRKSVRLAPFTGLSRSC